MIKTICNTSFYKFFFSDNKNNQGRINCHWKFSVNTFFTILLNFLLIPQRNIDILINYQILCHIDSFCWNINLSFYNELINMILLFYNQSNIVDYNVSLREMRRRPRRGQVFCCWVFLMWQFLTFTRLHRKLLGFFLTLCVFYFKIFI